MAVYHNLILEKLENAVKTFLAANLTLTLAANVHQGFSKDELTGQYVTAIAESAEANVNFDGNWSCNLEIEVGSNADDVTWAEHSQRFGEAVSYFFTGTIADDLSANGTDFSCFFVIPKKQWKLIRARKWVSTASFQIECCGSSGV